MSDRERWDARYRQRPHPTVVGPSAALQSMERLLPRSGTALDLAGGDGAHAVWLATRGLDVTLADVSAVALDRASTLAQQHNVPLTCVRSDLEVDPFPKGPWTLIVCSNYVQRAIWRPAAAALEVDGLAVWLHPTRRNLERHTKPSARFLLGENEAPLLFEEAGLEILHCETGWVGDEGRHEGRHMVRIVGRRTQPTNLGVPRT